MTSPCSLIILWLKPDDGKFKVRMSELLTPLKLNDSRVLSNHASAVLPEPLVVTTIEELYIREYMEDSLVRVTRLGQYIQRLVAQ